MDFAQRRTGQSMRAASVAFRGCSSALRESAFSGHLKISFKINEVVIRDRSRMMATTSTRAGTGTDDARRVDPLDGNSVYDEGVSFTKEELAELQKLSDETR